MAEAMKNKILFIDDNLSNHELINTAFMRHGNNSLLLFLTSAEAGLGILKKEAVKAVFVNQYLPGKDGFDFLKELKSLKIQVPVIMLISGEDKTVVQKAIREGANDWVINDARYFDSLPFVLDCAIARYDLDRERTESGRLIIESHHQWMALIDGITDFVFITDEESRIFKTNRALATAFGKNPKDILGIKCHELLGIDLSKALSPSIENSLPHAEERTINNETYLISSFPLHYNNMPLTIHLMKNITEIRRMKEQLYHSYKLASLGLLVSGVAHEINNPLTGVITYTELLRMKVMNEEIKWGLKKILESAERCKKVVENLLTFSRQRMPSKSLESINDLIDRTIDLRIYWLRKNNIEIVKEYGELPTLLVDSQQLQLAILNVLLNAEQAIGSNINNGMVTFSTRYDKEKHKVIIKISDNGPGIPQDIISKIFDPFFTTKPVGTGTGLGLSISHGIIAEHEGNIRVESSEGKGATFFIELPQKPKNVTEIGY
jgi:signal transduction histidine kinase/DNA-binding NarL/FixJ family response regulator